MPQSPQPIHLRRLLQFSAFVGRLTLLGSIALAVAPSSAWAQRTGKADSTAWYTGSAFRRQLQLPVSALWDKSPLRTTLQNFSQAQRIAIFLDRRVDPGQRISFRCDQVPLEQALRDLARPLQLGVGFVGPVVYIGPPLTCARIATLAERRNEQIQSLPTAAQHRMLARTPLTWPDLTEPRLLFAGTASQVGMTVPNIRTIPHDLWFEAELPPMTFPEKATLLAAGFDMSFSFHKNASQVYLAKFPRAVTIERDYRTSNPQRLARLLNERFPQAYVSVDEDRKSIKVRSLLEDHWKIDTIRSGKKTKPPASSSPSLDEKRFTLKIDNQPVGPVLELLAKQWQLTIEFTESIDEEERAQLVSVAVTEATADEMLNQIAKPVGLRVKIDGDTLSVSQPQDP